MLSGFGSLLYLRIHNLSPLSLTLIQLGTTGIFRVMKPGEPIFVGGKPYYYTAAAASIVGVSDATMWSWATKGVTSFEFPLDVVRGPPCPWHNKVSRRKSPDFRLLVSEENVVALKRILGDFNLNRRGRTSDYELETLKLATKQYEAARNLPEPIP